MTEAFDAARSTTYDTRIRRMVPGYDVLHRLADTCIAADLGPEASVLMVGAGTGTEVLESGLRHPLWTLTAVEPAPDMSLIGRTAIETKGLSARVHWHEGPLDTLEAPEPFDAATLMLVLHFLSDKDEKSALLSGIADRLKPGAPFVIASYFGDPGATRTKKLYDLSQAWAVSNGMTPEDALNKLDPNRRDMHVVSEERIKGLLRETGFIDVQRIYQGLLIGAWAARTQR
jgi:tRNA (cmo5U34)-methyltransferase